MTYSWGRRVGASLLTGLVIAVVVHLAAVIAFGIGYLGNTTSPTSFGLLLQVGGYFEIATILVFVLVAVAGIIGALSRWWTAIISGVVITLVAVVINTLVQVLAGGTKFSPSVLLYLWLSFGAINIVYATSLVVLVPTFGRWLFRSFLVFRGRRLIDARVALVRIPASNLSEGLVTHIDRKPINSELADQQWDAYVAALAAAGWQTVEVAPADKLADSVFVEDTAIVLGDTAVIGRSGAPSRRDEATASEASLRELGLDIHRIDEPGTLDGGDVLSVGSTVYVGRSDRTNAEGIRQLRAILTPLGHTVIAVPVTKALHLKSAVTALPDGTVIGYPPLIDDTSVFDRFLAVPEAEGAAVVVLGDDSVLISAAAPRSAALIEDLGYRVTTVDVSEFEKLEGCVTCLSVRVH
jgi:dimethylargininase